MASAAFHRRAEEGHGSADQDGLSTTWIIVLSTTIPTVTVVLLAGVVFYCIRRKNLTFLKRGITPIDDEEIESWRTEKQDEKSVQAEPTRRHQQSMSASSIQKPPSIMIYQRDASFARPSFDRSPAIPRSSVDVPAPVLALAPNARPGLTDEMIQGDDAFVPRVKRQPSRLAKTHPTSSASRHQQKDSWATRTSVSGNRDGWYGSYSEDGQVSARQSGERRRQTPPPQVLRGHSRVYSSSSIPPWAYDEDYQVGGLSPRPLLHQSDIGRAIG